ncbi:MAG: thermonuclease family protein [Candidatus Omnitrophica bacterium]|nr:thermonuclease family protein [Candidatus Omnitrophota bacterium]
MQAFFAQRFTIILFSLWVIGSQGASGASDRVHSLSGDGSLELESGQKVSLAGIRLAPEAMRILPALLSGKDIEIEFDPSLERDGTTGLQPAFVYVKTQELTFPFSHDLPPTEKQVMLNEILLSMGAARVDTSVPFKRKAQFVEIEMQAKAKGEGIWSYELFDKAPTSENS